MFEVLKTNITDKSITKPINWSDWEFNNCKLTQFDREGYELLPIEQEYYKANAIILHKEDVLAHESGQRSAWYARSNKWIKYKQTHRNLFMDHAMVVARPVFEGEALQQLKQQAIERPELNKLIHTKAKWGHDFCLDWIDDEGVTEIIHWEWDFTSFQEYEKHRQEMENLIVNTDWIDHASKILKKYRHITKLTSEELGDLKAQELGLEKAFRLYKTL